jgi:hypothetical protein
VDPVPDPLLFLYVRISKIVLSKQYRLPGPVTGKGIFLFALLCVREGGVVLSCGRTFFSARYIIEQLFLKSSANCVRVAITYTDRSFAVHTYYLKSKK